MTIHTPTAGASRRAILAAMPVALVAAPAAALCVLDPADTPVMKLFREWRAITELVTRDAPMTEAELAEATERRYAIKDQMFATPALTAQDVLAKLIASTTWGDFDLEGDEERFWADARALMSAA